MSSSTEPSRSAAPGAAVLAVLPELRTGEWTRLGGATTLGDLPTERVLAGLAESTRSAARAQGYAVGWSEGRREASAEAARESADAWEHAATQERRREAEHQAAVASLLAATEQLSRLTERSCAAMADHAVELACELTEALVGHELRLAHDLGEEGHDLVRRVLALLPHEARVSLRVMPGALDAAAARELADHRVTVLADPDLAPGEAFVETDEGALDLGVASGLRRIREVLS